MPGARAVLRRSEDLDLWRELSDYYTTCGCAGAAAVARRQMGRLVERRAHEVLARRTGGAD
ncbi:MAG: hypothetical protein ACOC4K_01195 [Verrucomicrobiota bacterium]